MFFNVFQDESRLVFEDDVEEPEEVEEEPDELDDEDRQAASASEHSSADNVLNLFLARGKFIILFCFRPVWTKLRNQDIMVSCLALV